MSITKAEVQWDRVVMHVCEHSLEPGCFCAYCSDETRDALPVEEDLVRRIYDHWKGLARQGINPWNGNSQCPEDTAIACHDCQVRWWCDPDFWIPLALGQIDEDGSERERIVQYPKGGNWTKPGHPKQVVKYP